MIDHQSWIEQIECKSELLSLLTTSRKKLSVDLITHPSDDGYRAIESVVEVESFRPTTELTALAEAWQAEIGETGKLVCNKVDMNRKDYLKHTRTITQEQLLDDPLMYVLFRSEEQPEGNFFHWLERFPRAKV
jgi:hypothetical protein